MSRDELSPIAPRRQSPKYLRTRFWIESGMGVLSATLALLTLIWPDWIERIFGYEPDAGNGSIEVSLTVAMAIATVVLALLARSEWRSRTSRMARA
jgi:hypothetical protein